MYVGDGGEVVLDGGGGGGDDDGVFALVDFVLLDFLCVRDGVVGGVGVGVAVAERVMSSGWWIAQVRHTRHAGVVKDIFEHALQIESPHCRQW